MSEEIKKQSISNLTFAPHFLAACALNGERPTRERFRQSREFCEEMLQAAGPQAKLTFPMIVTS